jgi:twinkle protein
MKDFASYGIDCGGKSGTEVKVQCPKCSHLRRKKTYPCLNVNVDKGVWHCWHCGWSGGLIQGEYNAPTVAHKKLFVKPEHRPGALTDAALSFFDKRGITIEVIARNRIAVERVWMPQIEDEVNSIAFPYVRHSEIVNVKYRDGAKNFRQVAGAEKTLYKYDDIDDECTIITEGEMDALAIEVAGFKNAVSVPDGAPAANAKTFDNKFEFLEDERLDLVKRFIIAVDNDEPGRKLEEELSRRLGRERCSRVIWMQGCKDANDVLVKFGAEILKECIESATPYPVEGVFSVMDIEDDLQSLLDNGLPQGEPTGWSSVDKLYTPAAGQWTLVTGIPSMGKSEWLDALAINIAETAGWVFGVCSPENQPLPWHIAKLLEKRMQKRIKPGSISEQEFAEAKLWLHNHFHFIIPEVPTLESVLEKAKALVRRHGLKGLIIDPYNELDHTRRKEGISETEYVSAFLTQLRTFARQQSVHIWLVAHPAKLFKDKSGEYPVPDGYTVSGSAHFYNKADNIIAVHRDVNNPNATTEVHVQKIRSRWLGNRGVANIRWRPECGRFSDIVDGPSPWQAYGGRHDD